MSKCRSVWHNHVKKTLAREPGQGKKKKLQTIRKLAGTSGDSVNNRGKEGAKLALGPVPRRKKKGVLIQQHAQDRRDIWHAIKK